MLIRISAILLNVHTCISYYYHNFSNSDIHLIGTDPSNLSVSSCCFFVFFFCVLLCLECFILIGKMNLRTPEFHEFEIYKVDLKRDQCLHSM